MDWLTPEMAAALGPAAVIAIAAIIAMFKMSQSMTSKFGEALQAALTQAQKDAEIHRQDKMEILRAYTNVSTTNAQLAAAIDRLNATQNEIKTEFREFQRAFDNR